MFNCAVGLRPSCSVYSVLVFGLTASSYVLCLDPRFQFLLLGNSCLICVVCGTPALGCASASVFSPPFFHCRCAQAVVYVMFLFLAFVFLSLVPVALFFLSCLGLPEMVFLVSGGVLSIVCWARMLPTVLPIVCSMDFR